MVKKQNLVENTTKERLTLICKKKTKKNTGNNKMQGFYEKSLAERRLAQVETYDFYKLKFVRRVFQYSTKDVCINENSYQETGFTFFSVKYEEIIGQEWKEE